jgi:hypothetical protein
MNRNSSLYKKYIRIEVKKVAKRSLFVEGIDNYSFFFN